MCGRAAHITAVLTVRPALHITTYRKERIQAHFYIFLIYVYTHTCMSKSATKAENEPTSAVLCFHGQGQI